MATRADVDRIRTANRTVASLASSALDSAWSALDPSDPYSTRDALLLVVPAISDTYGNLAAVAAADWFDDLRAAAGIRGRHLSTVAPTVAPEIVRARVRYACRHLFSDDPEATRSFVDMALSGYVLQPGRDTIVRNVETDPTRPGWARVPTREHVCAFCLLYAARGPIHGRGPADATTYHGRCECVATPFWSGDELPDGYDPVALRAMTRAAAAAADSRSRTDVLSELRSQQDIS